ncbi:Mobile element protein [Richelia intracellularis]|nr:Mobile element protein [Richelia intracellularis]
MFKMLVLQQQYNISDEELEYQVNDRLSFMRFLGLGLAEPVPDATTVWLFRQQLKQQGLIEELFEQLICSRPERPRLPSEGESNSRCHTDSSYEAA